MKTSRLYVGKTARTGLNCDNTMKIGVVRGMSQARRHEGNEEYEIPFRTVRDLRSLRSLRTFVAEGLVRREAVQQAGAAGRTEILRRTALRGVRRVPRRARLAAREAIVMTEHRRARTAARPV